MANAEKNGDKDRKFFFDLHNFDDPAGANDEPPPPTYSQDDLSSAQAVAMEQGRQKGLNEANNSREQKVAQLLQQISTQFATLFAAEQERESRYEEEVILLTLTALDKLFPTLNDTIGPLEMEQAVTRILQSAVDQSEITIRVHPDFTQDIEGLLAPFRAKDVNPPNFHIIGDETLGPGDCRLSWADGGAVRDAQALSQTIRNELLSLLPEKPPETVTPDATMPENNDINEEVRAESPTDDSSDAPSGDENE